VHAIRTREQQIRPELGLVRTRAAFIGFVVVFTVVISVISVAITSATANSSDTSSGGGASIIVRVLFEKKS
jgi:hypothetical protein